MACWVATLRNSAQAENNLVQKRPAKAGPEVWPFDRQESAVKQWIPAHNVKTDLEIGVSTEIGEKPLRSVNPGIDLLLVID